jgi:hypothetical protein
MNTSLGVWSIASPILFLQLFKSFPDSRPSTTQIQLQAITGIGMLVVGFGCFRRYASLSFWAPFCSVVFYLSVPISLNAFHLCRASMNTKSENIRWANMIAAGTAWVLWLLSNYLAWRTEGTIIRPSQHLINFTIALLCGACLCLQPAGTPSFRPSEVLKLLFDC